MVRLTINTINRINLNLKQSTVEHCLIEIVNLSKALEHNSEIMTSLHHPYCLLHYSYIHSSIIMMMMMMTTTVIIVTLIFYFHMNCHIRLHTCASSKCTAFMSS